MVDFQELWEQVQEKLNDLIEQSKEWPDIAREYFTNLSRMELYVWAGFGLGFVLFIVGFFVWL